MAVRVEFPEIRLLGTKVTLCTKNELLEAIHHYVKSNQKALVLSGNVHSVNLAYETPWLQEYMNQAEIVRLDGAGLRLGARLLGWRTPTRMTWADFAWDLAKFCEDENIGLFFLGNRPGVAQRAARKLQEKTPGLRMVGHQHGYFAKEAGNPETVAVIRAINAAKADIVIVGLGMPLQEKWLRENRAQIEAPVVMTGGAVFEWLAGVHCRAPNWMMNNGMEWLWRLIIEPKRLWRRYLLGNPLFVLRILKQRFLSRGVRKPSP